MKPKEWLLRAKRFLLSAEHNLESGLYDIACFDSYQAAELAFKALHIKVYGTRPYTHDLTLLARVFGYKD